MVYKNGNYHVTLEANVITIECNGLTKFHEVTPDCAVDNFKEICKAFDTLANLY